MQIKFSDERIKEYYEGGLHILNDGEPLEVSELQGNEMLKAIHFLDDKQVPVFEKVKEPTANDESEAEDEEADDREPEEVFLETAEQLAKKTRAELIKMAVDAGLDGDNYTNKTELAQAIVAARDAAAIKEPDETEG